MPTFNIKDRTPEEYPAHWHQALHQGFRHIVEHPKDKLEIEVYWPEEANPAEAFKKVRAARNRFKAFKQVLMATGQWKTGQPPHPLCTVIIQCEVWTCIKQKPSGEWVLTIRMWKKNQVSWVKTEDYKSSWFV